MRTFNVCIYRPGEGDNTYSEPVIRFFDPLYAQPKFPEIGQFTGGSYFLSTLLEDRERLCERGLNMQGGVPEWSVEPEQMRLVFALIDQWLAKNKGKVNA